MWNTIGRAAEVMGESLFDAVRGEPSHTPADPGANDLVNGLRQEGVRGLLDMTGMLDRQLAQRELADRFTVLSPWDFLTGARPTNAVTEREYEDIARIYSDIRLGRGDLTIDAGYHDGHRDAKGRDMHGTLTDPAGQEAFREGALRDIAALMQTTSGRHEIERLHDNVHKGRHMHTTLAPFLRPDGTPDVTDAESSRPRRRRGRRSSPGTSPTSRWSTTRRSAS